MMSTVTPLTRSIDRELVKKLFRKFSGVYGNLWNSRCITTEDWNECVTTWLDGIKSFEFDVLKRAVTQSFLAYKNFPPTLGQLVDICLKESGIPPEDMIISDMVRRVFSHPLSKLVYDRIGSWEVTHGKTEEIRSRVKLIYGECLSHFQESPNKAWTALEEFQNLKALPIPDKIPTKEECIGFKERMKLYHEKSAQDKLRMGDKSHPEWPMEQVTECCKAFDKQMFEERKKYLLEMDELMAGTLSKNDWYDRVRFLREIEASQHIEKSGYQERPREEAKSSHRSFNGSKVTFNHWMKD